MGLSQVLGHRPFHQVDMTYIYEITGKSVKKVVKKQMIKYMLPIFVLQSSWSLSATGGWQTFTAEAPTDLTVLPTRLGTLPLLRFRTTIQLLAGHSQTKVVTGDSYVLAHLIPADLKLHGCPLHSALPSLPPSLVLQQRNTEEDKGPETILSTSFNYHTPGIDWTSRKGLLLS